MPLAFTQEDFLVSELIRKISEIVIILRMYLTTKEVAVIARLLVMGKIWLMNQL